MELDNIYRTLNEINLCDSAYEFSCDYLGKSKGYYGVIKSKEVSPSIDSILMLEEVLLEKIQDYSKYDYETYQQKKGQLTDLFKQAEQLRKEYCIAKRNKHNGSSDYED